jgi:hypothetical protein
MATTTLTLIREQQETTIEGLTPDSLSSALFRVERGHADFREWAEEHPNACFRRFEIVDLGNYPEPTISTRTVQQERVSVDVVVAYPRKDSMYGSDGIVSIRDIMREDMYAIDTAIGVRGSGNYASGQNAAMLEGDAFEEGEAVDFLVLSYDVHFAHATT